jgi:hypothetical protein
MLDGCGRMRPVTMFRALRMEREPILRSTVSGPDQGSGKKISSRSGLGPELELELGANE